MRTRFAAILLLVLPLLPVAAPAQERNDSIPATVVERGPHHRVVERIVSETLPDGTVRERKSSYTELATGMHYIKEGQWTESKEEIEIFEGAAIARQGAHQVIFAANLNSPGSIDLVAPDGKRFRSHVLGLAYTDYASGRSVMIADVKDSTGAVQAPNKVIYQDAFDGDCVANVRYTYTRNGFEQDIILLTAPPSPAEWGLNPETTRLEVFTEFIESPDAQVTPVVLKREENALARQVMVEPDLVDNQLNFGGMKIEQGYAFPLGGDVDPFSESTVPTGKSFERIGGRLFLIEKVDYPSVREKVAQLPQAAAIRKDRKVGAGRTMMAALLPAVPGGKRGKWTEAQFAKVDAVQKGFVLDYVSVTTSSLTNYTFKSDTTYHVTGTVDLYGTTVFEGLAVVKYNATSANLRIRGPVDCRTAPYRPLILTGKDDDTVGEFISGSTGTPTNYYGASSEMLQLLDATTTYEVHDVHVFHTYRAILATSNGKVNISNLQVSKSRYAFGQNGGSTITCRNFLFRDLERCMVLSGTPTNRSEHGTIHRVGDFRTTTNGLYTLTNCLLISVTNSHYYEGAYVVTNLDDTEIFQTVGAGAHYLASGSTNRNAGTTNINPQLLANLRKLTTYPPIVLTNSVAADTTLSAQAQRDTDIPDIGYHYYPLDFVASQVAVTNATLTLQAGTALGIYGSSSAPGLVLLDGAKVISEGSPDNLNRIARYNLIQEKANTNWSASNVGRSITTVSPYGTNLLSSEARFRFTEFAMPANGNDHIYAGATNLTFSAQDSQFHGGQITAVQPNVTLLNNLFNRVAFKLYANVNPFNALVRNGTFFGGTVTLSNAVSGGWNFSDNLFDTTNLVQVGFVTNNYNAYLTNSARLTNNGVNDVKLTVTNITYDTGSLGSFYLPTNLTSHSVLFNSGSQNATNAGLYHFTTTTNQVKETNSVVDIGFHYVAVNSGGQLIDTDGDGLPDYLEDSDGDGAVDSGETDWNDPGDLGLRVFITRPRNGSTIP